MEQFEKIEFQPLSGKHGRPHKMTNQKHHPPLTVSTPLRKTRPSSLGVYPQLRLVGLKFQPLSGKHGRPHVILVLGTWKWQLSFNPSQENTAVLTPPTATPDPTATRFNPSQENTAVLTPAIPVGSSNVEGVSTPLRKTRPSSLWMHIRLSFAYQFQPLSGKHGRPHDRNIVPNVIGLLVSTPLRKTRPSSRIQRC